MRQEFPAKVRKAAFERANKHCERCSAFLYAGKFAYDHILPDGLGGEPTLENCAVLCSACHDKKTATQDVPAIAKADRIRSKHIDARPRSSRPLPGGRNSPWKKPFNKPPERRA